jgi:hypothetical protein
LIKSILYLIICIISCQNVDYFTSPKINSLEILQKDYNHDCAHDLFFIVADRQAGRTIVFANYKPTLTQAPIIELIVGHATKTDVQRCVTQQKKNQKNPPTVKRHQ